jgi:hypothetical protein
VSRGETPTHVQVIINYATQELEEDKTREVNLRTEIETQNTKVAEEKNDLFAKFQAEKFVLMNSEAKLAKTNSQKTDPERQSGVCMRL